jgi:hypothetical protein
MRLRGRTDVVKGDEFVVFVDFLTRDFTRGDLAEETVRVVLALTA